MDVSGMKRRVTLGYYAGGTDAFPSVAVFVEQEPTFPVFHHPVCNTSLPHRKRRMRGFGDPHIPAAEVLRCKRYMTINQIRPPLETWGMCLSCLSHMSQIRNLRNFLQPPAVSSSGQLILFIFLFFFLVAPFKYWDNYEDKYITKNIFSVL